MREADRDPVNEAAKRQGGSGLSIYGWRKRLGEFNVHEVKRLRAVEAENARLRMLLGERDLEIDTGHAIKLAGQ